MKNVCQNRRKQSRKCGEKCENLKELKKHKQQGKCFTDDWYISVWKLRKKFYRGKKTTWACKWVNRKFECDECDKVFNYETVLNRHTEAVDEECKLFCHYFNNDKECPYDDQCIYLHEESSTCKFGKGCERILCML